MCHQSLADTFHWVPSVPEFRDSSEPCRVFVAWPWVVLQFSLKSRRSSAFLFILLFKYYDKCT